MKKNKNKHKYSRGKKQLSKNQIIIICTILTLILGILGFLFGDNFYQKYIASVYKTAVITSGQECYKSTVAKISMKNMKLSSYRVTDSYIKIEDIKQNNIEYLYILANQSDIKNSHIQLYAINNGQKMINESTLEISILDDNTNIDISYFNQTEITQTIYDLKPGEIRKLKEIHIPEQFNNFCIQNNISHLGIYCKSNQFDNIPEELSFRNNNGHLLGLLLVTDSGIEFDSDGSGAPGDEKTSYDQISVDVDKDNGKEIKFKTNPIIYDQLDLITEIFPDKSCTITYSLHYILDGDKEISSENITTNIFVPMYGQNFEESDTIYNKLDGRILKNQISSHNIDNYQYNSNKEIQNEIAYNRTIYMNAKKPNP